MNKSYYQILGVSDTATFDEINRSYRKLAAKYHPDINHSKDAPAKFKAVQDAFNVLKNPDKRARYDTLLNNDMPPELLARARKNQNKISNLKKAVSNEIHKISEFGNFAPLFEYFYKIRSH